MHHRRLGAILLTLRDIDVLAKSDNLVTRYLEKEGELSREEKRPMQEREREEWGRDRVRSSSSSLAGLSRARGRLKFSELIVSMLPDISRQLHSLRRQPWLPLESHRCV